MYHPYFRGKQYELITIRETAELLAASNFVPIIEPVKESLGGLQRTLKSICDVNGKAIIIVNPFHGDHSESGEEISDLLKSECADKTNITAGVLLDKNMTKDMAIACCDQHSQHSVALIHSGFTSAKELVENLGQKLEGMSQIFVEEYCGKLYRKHFVGTNRILLRDGFERRRNRDHPDLELFSDLHITYTEEGMDGFGDFLIVGDDYSESGGPAYAVAIHLTSIDPDKDSAMFVHHFVSKRRDSPTDPAGKFGEALKKLIDKVDEPASNILESTAVKEFRELHKKGHFPGLGYVKKLSMKHHIETLAQFLT